MADYIIIIAFSVFFILLSALTLAIRFMWKSLIKNGDTAVGVVESVKRVKSNGYEMFNPIIRYHVNGKAYTIKNYMSKVYSFENTKEVNIRYSKRFPHFSEVLLR